MKHSPAGASGRDGGSPARVAAPRRHTPVVPRAAALGEPAPPLTGQWAQAVLICSGWWDCARPATALRIMSATTGVRLK